MIGVRVIVTDYANTAAASVIIGPFRLLRRYQIARLAVVLTFVLGCVDFGQKIDLPLAHSQKKPTTLVRVSLLAVLPYLIQVS